MEKAMNNIKRSRVRDFETMGNPTKDEILYLRISEPEKDFLRTISSKMNVSMSKLVMDTVMLAWAREYNQMMVGAE